MQIATYASEEGPRLAAMVDADNLVDLNQANSKLPATMPEFLAMGDDGIQLAKKAAASAPRISRASVRLLAPVVRPNKIFCIGLNYADHARETGKEPPSEPVVFCKFATAIRGPGDPIVIPKLTSKVDYEAELVAVIGNGGRHIPQARALEHVAGYTCGQDVSARDWQTQKPGGQWLLGKSFDGFAPIGPAIVTRDELNDASDLRITLRLNGQTMQDSRTSQLIFSIPYLVSYISGVCTLEPGDLIFTGTPPGVGVARKPPVYMRPGDTVEIEIEGIGALKNPVIAEE